MTRRRFIYPRDGGEPFEVGADYVAEPDRQTTDACLWGDRGYENLPSENGPAINSRSRHREYMRRNGVTTMDDFKDQWKRQEKTRDDYRTTGKGGAVTRDDVGRAIHRLESGS